MIEFSTPNRKREIRMNSTSGPVMNNRPCDSFLRLHQVLQRVPVSRSGWWQGVKDGRFPKPIKLSPRVTVWRASEVQAYIDGANTPDKAGASSSQMPPSVTRRIAWLLEKYKFLRREVARQQWYRERLARDREVLFAVASRLVDAKTEHEKENLHRMLEEVVAEIDGTPFVLPDHLAD